MQNTEKVKEKWVQIKDCAYEITKKDLKDIALEGMYYLNTKNLI